jgi:hypothetical protein
MRVYSPKTWAKGKKEARQNETFFSFASQKKKNHARNNYETGNNYETLRN